MKTLTGYSDHISLYPGETISFFVSSANGAPYQARVIRIINGDLNPKGPGYRDEPIASDIERSYDGFHQPIRAGSYAVVPTLGAIDELSSFTVQVLIWPTTPMKCEQTLVACWKGRSGFQLRIDQDGSAGLKVGDGRSERVVSTGKALLARCWYSVSGSYDSRTGTLTVSQSRLDTGSLDHDQGEESSSNPMQSRGYDPARGAPLTLAALLTASAHEDGDATNFYNGKLESPRLFSDVLDSAARRSSIEDIKARKDLVAAWDFSLDIYGEAVRDISRHALHGQTVHMPTRAMTGHNWTGEEMCWERRPDHYAAIHFHDDDVYDAGWTKSFDWRVPEGLRSGVYCAHIFNDAGEEFIPFVVRPARGGACKPLVFLLPTASYMAYANERLGIDHDEVESLEGKLTIFYEQDLFLAEHREYGNSLYGHHSDGSGSAYSSRLRPILNMRPKVQSYMGGTGSAIWQFNADTHILDFLEAKGLEFDVVTDEDLDREGVSVLEG